MAAFGLALCLSIWYVANRKKVDDVFVWLDARANAPFFESERR